MDLRFLLYLLTAFLLGSIPFCVIVPQLVSHMDIVAISDDHNPGSANVIKHMGWKWGSLCLVLEIFKGILPVYMFAQGTNPADWHLALIVAAPVIGHAFSPFLHFHGGKAVAVTFGVLIGALPVSPILCLLVFALLFTTLCVRIDPHSMRVICSMIFTAAAALAFEGTSPAAVGFVLIALAVCYRHIVTAELGFRFTLLPYSFVMRKIRQHNSAEAAETDDKEKKAI